MTSLVALGLAQPILEQSPQVRLVDSMTRVAAATKEAVVRTTQSTRTSILIWLSAFWGVASGFYRTFGRHGQSGGVEDIFEQFLQSVSGPRSHV